MKLSVTKISTYLDCPRKFWYRYELHLKTPKSGGFYFGSAVHQGLENYYLGKDPIQGVTDALFGKKDSIGEEVKEGVNLVKLEKEARRIFEIYSDQAPHFEPLLVEHFFEVPLVHPETKEELPATFRGKIDLITEDGAVVDHKTASGSSNGFWAKKNTLQANGYSYAYLQMFGKLPSRVIFNTIIKGNTRREPRFEPDIRGVTTEDTVMFFEECREALNAIAKGEAMNSPNKRHCRFCSFKAICPYYARR